MEYIEATRQVGARLADAADHTAAAGAVQLAIEAWKSLAGSDLAWDQFGLELLDIRARLYSEYDDVVVNAAAPVRDDAETRLALTALVEQLARYHERLAVDDRDDLARRLSHDAGAQQLRRAAAALA
ncbi:hypothetical protein [Micromonospora sp. WMMA1947]|uniref:hypothetical protein n=1 Tax=Micromonospora sp. WMMA1947 TaxID=3015163 RepID=UPI00248CB3AF|nr:hypothetical protein [Micromonospora sp. WMMA1947]WBC08890.1 hypothetical protein O7604_27305 [Micromonospora sp. WMMA1947]